MFVDIMFAAFDSNTAIVGVHCTSLGQLAHL